jgi:hypothetical protein
MEPKLKMSKKKGRWATTDDILNESPLRKDGHQDGGADWKRQRPIKKTGAL